MAERPTILIVDDEVHLVRLLEMNLKRHGFAVQKAYDGHEGLAAASGKPDLILLDVNMPRMDGFEMLGQMKLNPDVADIPVIMLTARSRNEDLRYGIEHGVEWYLTKPVDLSELLQMIRKLLPNAGVISSAAEPDSPH